MVSLLAIFTLGNVMKFMETEKIFQQVENYILYLLFFISGTRLLALPPVPKDQHYKERVKNIGVICGTLRHVLSGGYLPFGVFWIYGDNCLNNSLDIAFKLFVRLQEEDLLVSFSFIHYYTKVCFRLIRRFHSAFITGWTS